jgi:hypothetical protein
MSMTRKRVNGGAAGAVPVPASQPNSSEKASSTAAEMPPMGTVAWIPA